MVLNIKNTLLLFITLTVNICVHVTSQNITDISSFCKCNLNIDYCDQNCCCDPKCTSLDLISFNCADLTNRFIDNKMCLPTNALFQQNTEFMIKTVGDLTCINTNVALSLNYYSMPVKTLSNNMMALIIDLNPKKQALPTSNSKSLTKNDYVWLLFANNYVGYLTLPTNSKNLPVNYFVNKETQHVLSISDISSACSTTNTLNKATLGYYIKDFRILQNPTSLLSCYNSFENQMPPTFSYYTSCISGFLTVGLNQCTSSDGTVSACSQNLNNLLSPSTTNGVCNNVVKSLTFIMRYQNTQSGLLEAAVNVEFVNVNVASPSTVQQKLKVVFINSAKSLSSTNIGTETSGYTLNEAIKAGPTATSITINGLTYLSPTVKGECPSDDSLRQPVKFNKNVFSECVYRTTVNTASPTYCIDLQTRIDQIILGFVSANAANFVSPYSNINEAPSLQIINSSPPSTVVQINDNLDGYCKSLRVGTTIQVAYTSKGNIENPQNFIKYVSYNWNIFQDVYFRCLSQNCITSQNLQLLISSRIIYVDLQKAEANGPKNDNTSPLSDLFFALSN